MNTTLIVAATLFEIAPLIEFLEKEGQRKNFSTYLLGDQSYSILITGVGPILTAHGLAKYFNIQKPGRAIHAGIAGAIDSLLIGEIVQVTQDRFGDVGIEESDGSFTDIYELELADPNFYPFTEGWLSIPQNGFLLNDSIRKVKGLTVSQVTGTGQTAQTRQDKYGAEIETMESASFFYACLSDHVDFISLRGISNYIGLRERTSWDIPKAIDALNVSLVELVQSV